MRLTILGCDGPYPAKNGATAGYLVAARGGNILLDAGSGVFARLSRHIQPETLSAVVLSHLHHDHISDMGVLNYYLEQLHRQGTFTKKIPCYLPAEKEAGVLNAEQMAKLYPYFEWIPMKEGEKYRIGGTEARFFALRHGVVDYGVRLEEDGKRFAYSGDTNVCPGLERLLEDCDFWLGGAPFIGAEYTESGGHLSVEVMQKIASARGIRAVVTHLCSRHTTEEYREVCTYRKMRIACPDHEYEI